MKLRWPWRKSHILYRRTLQEDGTTVIVSKEAWEDYEARLDKLDAYPVTAYCAQCGESPMSATHTFGEHEYVPPRYSPPVLTDKTNPNRAKPKEEQDPQ